jgi:hypothetical protein
MTIELSPVGLMVVREDVRNALYSTVLDSEAAFGNKSEAPSLVGEVFDSPYQHKRCRRADSETLVSPSIAV